MWVRKCQISRKTVSVILASITDELYKCKKKSFVSLFTLQNLLKFAVNLSSAVIQYCAKEKKRNHLKWVLQTQH